MKGGFYGWKKIITWECCQIFLKLNTNTSISWISNVVLCILVAQEMAKLPNVKFGGLKKILPLGPICISRVRPGLETRISFLLPNQTSCIFAIPWGTRIHSSLFESPEQGPIGSSLKKCDCNLKVFHLHSKSTYFNSTYLLKVPFLTGIAVYTLNW